jgi:hypothetical protein
LFSEAATAGSSVAFEAPFLAHNGRQLAVGVQEERSDPPNKHIKQEFVEDM